MYYIHNGFVGNTAMWWRLNNAGYTTDLGQAQTYTKKEAEGLCRNRPDEDFPVPRELAISICEQSVNIGSLKDALRAQDKGSEG